MARRGKNDEKDGGRGPWSGAILVVALALILAAAVVQAPHQTPPNGVKQTHWGIESDRDLPLQETRGKAIFLDANPTLCSDTYQGEDWGRPVCTFTRAHALATDGDGDWIYIKPGAYSGQVTITKRNLHVIGELVGEMGPNPTSSWVGDVTVGPNGCAGPRHVEISQVWAQSITITPASLACGDDAYPENINLHHLNSGLISMACTMNSKVHDSRVGNVNLGDTSCPAVNNQVYENQIGGTILIKGNGNLVRDNVVTFGRIDLACDLGDTQNNVIADNFIAPVPIPGGSPVTGCFYDWALPSMLIGNHWSKWTYTSILTPPGGSWVRVQDDVDSPFSGRLTITAIADPVALGAAHLLLRADHARYTVRLAPDSCYCNTNDPFPSVTFAVDGEPDQFDIWLKLDGLPPGNVPVTLTVTEG